MNYTATYKALGVIQSKYAILAVFEILMWR